MLRFPDILLYDTLRLADNKYFFGILKREYRSKNGVRFENVFFVTVSHIINRRRAPIAKSPIFFVLYHHYLLICRYHNAIFRLCDLCTHVNFVYFVQHVRDVQCSISKN